MRELRLKRIHACAAGAMLAALAPGPCSADGDGAEEPFGIEQALAHGRFSLELRPRYNRIDESDKVERAEGVTVRAVAGWRSAPFHGLRLTLEGIHTDHLGPKHFNDDSALFATSPYPLLPDPSYTGLNQAHVEYTGVEALRLSLGRQIVRMDDQRWVSDNDFRQIPQLFDGVSAVYTGIENTELSASHYWRMRSTSGVSSELKLSLLHAAWNPAPGHALAAYAYFHDQAQNGAFTGFADNSYRVIGVRAEGSAVAWHALDFPYTFEYAQQRPYADGDDRIEANYWRAGAGLASTAWTVRYDYEVKGSNAGLYGLQMPLTDFYAFNGWTLHFFNTPRTGLRDQWLTLRYAVSAFTLHAEAHRFRSDYASIGLGRENDVRLTYLFNENCLVRLQHSRYDPGAGTPDPRIRKTWLAVTFTY